MGRGVTVSHKLLLGDCALPHPVVPPAKAGIGVCGHGEASAREDVKDSILDLFHSRGKVGDEVMRLGIQTDDDQIGKKFGNTFIGSSSGEDTVVYPLQVILLKSAD